MSPEFYKKWSHIVEDVEKQIIPVDFIRKILVKLKGRKQHTINIERLLKKNVSTEDVENMVNHALIQLDDQIISMEFVLNIESIAETVQPETERLLNKLQ
jgi:hypothetical protein